MWSSAKGEKIQKQDENMINRIYEYAKRINKI